MNGEELHGSYCELITPELALLSTDLFLCGFLSQVHTLIIRRVARVAGQLSTRRTVSGSSGAFNERFKRVIISTSSEMAE